MKKIIGSLAAVAILLPSLALADVNISLSGGTVTVSQGSSYNEPGYSAFSTTDGDVTGSVSVDNPGTGTAGTFTIQYSVTDSALDSDTAYRTLVVNGGGGGQMYCFGPTAPGWDTNLPDGGCGSKVFSGEVLLGSVKYTCPWFITGGCVVK